MTSISDILKTFFFFFVAVSVRCYYVFVVESFGFLKFKILNE